MTGLRILLLLVVAANLVDESTAWRFPHIFWSPSEDVQKSEASGVQGDTDTTAAPIYTNSTGDPTTEEEYSGDGEFEEYPEDEEYSEDEEHEEDPEHAEL